MAKSIFEIEDLVRKVDVSGKSSGESFESLFYGIYSIETAESSIVIPESFKQKVASYFSDLGIDKTKKAEGEALDKEQIDRIVTSISTQKIVKIVNRYTNEGTMFNHLRAMRPGVKPGALDKRKMYVIDMIEKSKADCDFCSPELNTPEDPFGRIKGEYCITAANIAKYDRYHSLIIFKDHNPLYFSQEQFYDFIQTFLRWHDLVLKESADYIYPLLIWNCLPRAGASKVHGHMQILASTNPYPRLKNIVKAIKLKGDYINRIVYIHEKLDLLKRMGKVKVLAYLTPIKEGEVMIISDKIDEDFIEAIYSVVRSFIDILHIYNFNMSIQILPPENGEPYCIARIVDRGNPESMISDIASMELYAASVVARDPYVLAESIF